MPAWAKPERGNGEWVCARKTGRVIARMPEA